MNLKESFRYQNFLDGLLRCATNSVSNRDHCLTVTKTHLRNKANPETQDVTEYVDIENAYGNDDVLSFMEWLVQQKSILTQAISSAKKSSSLDLDAAIETNKFRQQVNSAIKSMLLHTPQKNIEKGSDYKFNVEGNQVSYYYDIEVETSDAYDRERAKNLMRTMISSADTTSAEIDSMLINTQVDYTPKYDVNESFEDVMENFITNR